jgi:hypothetical protein
MPMRCVPTFGLLAIASIVGSASCDSDPPSGCGPGDVATAASDVVALTNDEAAFYFACADPIAASLFGPSVAPAAVAPAQASVAAQIASASAANFPGGCATVTADQNFVTFVMDDCSGPLGLAHATGTVTAKLLVMAGGGVLVQLTGDNVAANGGTFTLNTSGSVMLSADGSRTVRATSMSNGTGASGSSLDHSGIFSLVWAPTSGCGTINANFSGVGASGENEVVVDYVACTGQCPSSGTSTAVSGSGTVTLSFVGKPYALCMASDGTSNGLPLACP